MAAATCRGNSERESTRSRSSIESSSVVPWLTSRSSLGRGRAVCCEHSILQPGVESPDQAGALWDHRGPFTSSLRSLSVGGRDPSTVEVAAPPSAVCLGSELSLKLHEAPDPGAVGAEVGFDVGGHLANRCQVDAEQLRAPLQRRRDRPAYVQVVPGPHRTSVSNTSSRMDREGCVDQQGSSEPGLAIGGAHWDLGEVIHSWSVGLGGGDCIRNVSGPFDGLAHEPRRHGVQLVCRVPWTLRRPETDPPAQHMSRGERIPASG